MHTTAELLMINIAVIMIIETYIRDLTQIGYFYLLVSYFVCVKKHLLPPMMYSIVCEVEESFSQVNYFRGIIF